MITLIKEKIRDTNIDVLVGIPDLLAIAIIFIGFQFDIKNLETDNLVYISIATFVFSFSFLFAIIKKEYPIYFKAKLRGKSAVIFGVTGFLVAWLAVFWLLIAAIRSVH
jgi:hypothetical protein